MQLSGYSKSLLAIARTVHRWAGAMAALDARRRDRVARYAEEIAATLARASEALSRLETDPDDRTARTTLNRELGRISGYIETLVGVLTHHLDGRKLAGVKRRLEQLEPARLSAMGEAAAKPWGPRRPLETDRLTAAEGYFRALADALRA